MAPIRKGDGTPLEIPGVSEVRSGDGRVFFGAIPDSVVSRTPDDEQSESETAFGMRFSTTETWVEIGFELSSNTDGPTRARLFNDEDDSLIGQKDISDLSGGDTFTIEPDEELVDGVDYSIMVDDEGSEYSYGRFGDDDTPYESEDGVLTIENSVRAEDRSDTVIEGAILKIGNVVFD